MLLLRGAGCGKTSTLLMLVPHVDLYPAVLCAFNKTAATDMAQKLERAGIRSNVQSKTIHALGRAAVARYINKINVEENKYFDLCRAALSPFGGYYSGEKMRDAVKVLKALVDMSRLMMIDYTDPATLERLALELDLEYDERILSCVQGVIEEGLDSDRIVSTGIDFTDMLWLPIVKDWDLPKYRTIFVDESQDLNSLQLEFVTRSLADGGRLVSVGDPRQAIYGWAGANTDSFYRVQERFGSVALPLQLCYRCGKAIVREANKIVPELQSPEWIHEGAVHHILDSELALKIKRGDVILCRTNAPLISKALEFIASGIPARVRGRQIGEQITGHIKRIGRMGEWSRFIEFTNAYRDREVAKYLAKNMVNKAESFIDIISCIYAVYDPELKSVEELMQKVTNLFSDELGGILLSSVHRAKGLEWDNVFIIRPDQLPLKFKNQSDETKVQEENLKYVAITRAIHNLYWVYDEQDKSVSAKTK